MLDAHRGLDPELLRNLAGVGVTGIREVAYLVRHRQFPR